MKRGICFLLTALVSLPATVFSQSDGTGLASPGKDMIAWSAERKLTWNDYKAAADMGTDAVATTTTTLTISYHFSRNGFSYDIISRFDPYRSWGSHRTPYILAHEQGHFDIAEIFARKLNKKMSEYQFDNRNYQQDLKKIYTDIIAEKEKMQNDYDEETKHSINETLQAAWLKKIARMLAELEAYKDYSGSE